MELSLRPLGNRVIVERLPEKEVTEGGIVIPNKNSLPKPSRGTVLAVGPGRVLEDGTLVEPGLEVGDIVLFGMRAGEELEIDGETVIVMTADEILAVDTNG